MSKASLLKVHLSQILNWTQNSSISPMCFCSQLLLFLNTLSIYLSFFFFLKPWMRTTAFVKLYFIELRHQRSRIHLMSGSFFHCASFTLAWVFYMVDQEETILIQCSTFNSIKTMSTATAQKCPTQSSPLTDISVFTCVCWGGGVGGCPGKYEFS